MALIQKFVDIKAQLGGPTPAEAELIKACQTGTTCILSGGNLPCMATPNCEVRSEVLRYLVLGGCNTCKISNGVSLEGAFITGQLDVGTEKTQRRIRIVKSHFDDDVIFERSQIAFLQMDASRLRRNFIAFGAHFKTSLSMNNLSVDGTINLDGVRIDGGWNLSGAHLARANMRAYGDGIAGIFPIEWAVDASALRIAGTITMHNVTSYAGILLTQTNVQGQVQLTNARIYSRNGYAVNLVAAKVSESVYFGDATPESDGKLLGAIDLSGATIGGQLSCRDLVIDPPEPNPILTPSDPFAGTGYAFVCQRTKVAMAFVWRNVTVIKGTVTMFSTSIGDLEDDMKSWLKLPDLKLDGFTYETIVSSPLELDKRMEWIEQGSQLKNDFRPQPFTQFANFLRETGHESEARTVLVRRDKLLAFDKRQNKLASIEQDRPNYVEAFGRHIWTHFRWIIFGPVFQTLAGYGHKPSRSLLALTMLIALAAFASNSAWNEGSFTPNSPVILNTSDWKAIQNIQGNPAAVWSGALPSPTWTSFNKTKEADDLSWQQVAPGRDWESFNSFVYGVDLVVPIIDFGQTRAWAPSTTRGPWGKRLWLAEWFFIAFGWGLSALGAAAITGVIRSN